MKRKGTNERLGIFFSPHLLHLLPLFLCIGTEIIALTKKVKVIDLVYYNYKPASYL